MTGQPIQPLHHWYQFIISFHSSYMKYGSTLPPSLFFQHIYMYSYGIFVVSVFAHFCVIMAGYPQFGRWIMHQYIIFFQNTKGNLSTLRSSQYSDPRFNHLLYQFNITLYTEAMLLQLHYFYVALNNKYTGCFQSSYTVRG